MMDYAIEYGDGEVYVVWPKGNLDAALDDLRWAKGAEADGNTEFAGAKILTRTSDEAAWVVFDNGEGY